MLTALTTLFLLCPIGIVPQKKGLFDMEVEHWILELPRNEVRDHLDTGCFLLQGKYT